VTLKLPDFPWDALAPIGEIARSHPESFIDLSQGTPVDPTPQFIQDALRAASNSPRYPVTTGTPELRQAIKDWSRANLGISGDFDVIPTIGSKELVAWLPTLLQAKSVLYPEIAYPTYLVGAILGGATHQTVGIDALQWPSADLAWVNSPSNPTGRIHSEEELRAVVEFSRRTGTVIASDECYLNFPASTRRPISIFELSDGDNRNLLAVHSLSKRSNLAGYRAAFVVGDSSLIAKILEIRKHVGMMVPLPVQRAMTVALGDEVHVQDQAARYRRRRTAMQSAIESQGFRVDHSDAGLYLWATRGEGDWESVKWFAQFGILVTPGHFYGEAGSHHVRIALTATDQEIEIAASRIRVGMK
jgi:succinyldiaminopimelate transaminase